MAERILRLEVDDDGNVLWIESNPVPDPGMIPMDHATTIADLEEVATHGRKPSPLEKHILEEILKSDNE